MSIYTVKRYSLYKFIGLSFALIYGFFIVGSLQYLYSVGSGDINSYIDYFEYVPRVPQDILERYGYTGDSIFRYVILFLKEFFQVEYIVLFKYIAFIISSISFAICAVNIRSSNRIFYLLPLLMMVLFSPNVVYLFASSIRAGIAFSLFLIAIFQGSALIRYILMGLSSIVHLSMAPLIFIYLLFYIVRNRIFNASSDFLYFLLIIFSLLIPIIAILFKYNITPVNSSFFYLLLTCWLAILLLFTSKEAVKNIYGFMSIGLILIVLFGHILDISFSRYIGNAVFLYLIFLVKEGVPYNIVLFSLGYVPFFVVTLFYSIANQM